MSSDDFEMGKFSVVCPECSECFELDDEIIEKDFEINAGQDFIKVTCPTCGLVRTFDV